MQKEYKVEEGRLMPDHIRMMISVPPSAIFGFSTASILRLVFVFIMRSERCSPFQLSTWSQIRGPFISLRTPGLACRVMLAKDLTGYRVCAGEYLNSRCVLRSVR
ncbi:hypothetical protein ACVIYL_008934 [Bradyrhizobium sp. USDA 3315]